MIHIKVKKLITAIIFFTFIITVIFSMSGYYQTSLQKKMILTNEAIDKFENDIKEGKEVDINNYVSINKKNYDNQFSKFGRNLSKNSEELFTKIINKTLKIILKSIED